MSANPDSPPSAQPAAPENARRSVEVAIAIILDPATQQILICKRKADAVLGGFWEFPGGKCGPSESPADCARRETAEETGLTIVVDRALAIIEHDYPHARVRLHPFLCHWTGGELQPLEVAEAKWVATEALADYPFPEANATLIRSLMNDQGRR